MPNITVNVTTNTCAKYNCQCHKMYRLCFHMEIKHFFVCQKSPWGDLYCGWFTQGTFLENELETMEVIQIWIVKVLSHNLFQVQTWQYSTSVWTTNNSPLNHHLQASLHHIFIFQRRLRASACMAEFTVWYIVPHNFPTAKGKCTLVSLSLAWSAFVTGCQ